MALKILVGDTKPIVFRIDGHSDLNGAPIPAGTTIALTSSTPVATVPPTVAVPTDTPTLDVPVTLGTIDPVAGGTTDITAVLTLPDARTFTVADTLVVSAAPAPGLTHVTGTLLQP